MRQNTILGPMRLAAAALAVAAAPAFLMGADVDRSAGPTSRPATAPAARPMDQIQADLQKASGEIQAALGDPQALFDPEKRKELAPKVIPPMKRMVGLMQEISAVQPQMGPVIAGARAQVQTMLALLGDADAAAALAEAAKSDDKAAALQGKTSQLMVRYWKASSDADTQGKVIGDLKQLAQQNPESDPLAGALMTMSQMGAASPAMRERLAKIIIDDLKGEAARQMSEQLTAANKIRSLEGKPLTLSGKTVDGKTLSTGSLKGKVVLVDFWATWCGPCLAELPRVTKAYADFHEKGLEIVGVSSDRSAAALKDFLEKHPDMPWPQLFDADNPGWHPLATEYGVTGIPTMFLIDRNGVVRSVEARADFEEQIPKLLEEKADPAKQGDAAGENPKKTDKPKKVEKATEGATPEKGQTPARDEKSKQ